MKTKLKYLKYIEDFFSGNMSKLEKERFQEEMRSNKTLAGEFREYTKLTDSIRDRDLLDFHKTIRKTFKEWQQNNKGFLQKYVSNKYWMAAAAAITILLISGITAIIIEITRSTEKIEIYAQDSTIIIETDSIKNILPLYEQDQIADENTVEEKVIFAEQLAIVTSIDYSKEINKISPIYKELLNSNMRSGQFQLIHPLDSAIFKQGETINIEFKTEHALINLDILNHKGQIKKSLQNISSAYQFQNDLSPGVYLLRFQTDEEPVWWGIVFISGGDGN